MLPTKMEQAMGAKDLINVDPDVVEGARSLGVEVDRAVEGDLRRRIERRKAALTWEQENRASVDAFNRYIDEFGTVGEEFRQDR